MCTTIRTAPLASLLRSVEGSVIRESEEIDEYVLASTNGTRNGGGCSRFCGLHDITQTGYGSIVWLPDRGSVLVCWSSR